MFFSFDSSLNVLFGKKGCGKTSALVFIARKALKKGYTVYSTVPIKGCFYFKPQDFGKFEFDNPSVVLIDEINLFWDNRNFAKFPQYTQDLLRYQRHFGITLFMFSQSFDCDKKIRDLADNLYLVKKSSLFPSFTKFTTIDKDFIVTQASDYGGSDITFGLSIRPFVLPRSRFYMWRKPLYKYFDSFSTYKLQNEKDFVTFCK